MLSNLIKTINRQQWISEAAYFKAEARGFEPGKALDDWREAEIAYLEMLITAYVTALEEDGPITVLGLRQLATLIGIDHADSLLSELELVRAIQDATNHTPCFRSTNGPCNEIECKWRSLCRKLIAVWYAG